MCKSPFDFRVRRIEYSDIEAIVLIHMKAFPNFFLSFLGPRFLSVFYNSFVNELGGRGFVAVDATGRVHGFLVGTFDPSGYFKRLLIRRGWDFCVASLTAVFRRPAVLPRLFRAIFYRGDPQPGEYRALLSSIAVDPDSQGHGIGTSLLNAWINEVQVQGMRSCYLTTDANENRAVNEFYKKCGWKLDISYDTREGRKMNRYIYNI